MSTVFGYPGGGDVRDLNSRLLVFHSYFDWLGQFTMGTVTNSWIAISIST